MHNTLTPYSLYSDQNTSTWTEAGKRASKLTLLVIAGGAVTLSLFVMMAELIRQEHTAISSMPPITLDPVIFQSEDEKTVFRPKIKPIEKVIKTPPSKIERVEPNDTSTGNEYSINTALPSTKFNIELNLNAAQGNMQATPQFRVDPAYPPQASRDGVEGWVKLGFTVSASGTVTDISVIDAKPSKVFNREARRALKKWKYKPKLVDGKPVAQYNMVVVLDFKLAQ
jgi:protein TonB